MRLKRERKDASVPLFSTSDIAFLLLIFIMLVSLINYRKTVNIQFAEAETARRVSVERNLEIWIDLPGNIYLDGDPVSLSLAETEITWIYRNAPDTRIHIIADRDTPFEKVHQVLEILQGMQYRLVSFVVRTETQNE